MIEHESSPVAAVRSMVFASLFSALIAVGSYLMIPLPIGPVPIALQSFFILFAGLLLGPRWGVASVAVFLLAGAIGLPVFAGAKGGLVHFAGPTGGYLFSYLPAVYLVGLIAERGKHSRIRDLIALSVGTVVIYLIGVSRLRFATGMSTTNAIVVGMLPFLPGDLVKIAVAAALAPLARDIVNPQDRREAGTPPETDSSDRDRNPPAGR